MRIAYADPPYIGYAHYYPEKTEVDHPALIAQLEAEYDGWALSTHTNVLALRQILNACPDTVRIGAWVKPFCSFKPGNFPYYAWEPIIFKPARHRKGNHNIVDWTQAPMTTRRGLKGAKPESVCYWLFDVLGMEPGDELIDVFPGTGVTGRSWEQWRRQPRLITKRKRKTSPASLWQLPKTDTAEAV